MRVLLVNDLPLDGGGGTEVYVQRLADGLAAAGDRVAVFAGEVQHRGPAKVLDVWDPWARRALGRDVERFRPDVVHHHNVVRELSAAVLGAPAGVASVMTVHDVRLAPGPARRPGSPRDAAYLAKGAFDRRVARRRVDVVTAVSATLADRLRADGFRDVAHVPAFAPAPPMASEPSGHDVCFAGRLDAGKGVLVLAEAFARVADRHPSARLLVAGEGPCREQLEALGRRLGPGRVALLGWVPAAEVTGLLARSRVAVAPAIEAEGAGLSPIEAALAGRASIVSDDAALREPVDASGGGIVVPAGDVAALAAALDRVLGDDGLAASLGAAGRAHALQHHTTEAAVAATRAAYRRALRRARLRTQAA